VDIRIFCRDFSFAEKNIMKFALDVCLADRRTGYRWISLKLKNESVTDICCQILK
jgi:hypothetical protein